MSKVRINREVSAMGNNLQAQRVLEKSMHTLDLEQTYSLKLLELDNRIIKVCVFIKAVRNRYVNQIATMTH